jgi:hypothetical protein
MILRHPALSSIFCSISVVVAAVACGGSAPPPAAADTQTSTSQNDSNTNDASASAPLGPSNDKAPEDASKLGFRFRAGGELTLNDMTLFEKGSTAKLTKLLGSPTREKVYPSKEKGLFYDQHGLVFWSVDGEIAGVGVNFNWDGDEKFPETSFPGTIALGDFNVDRNATQAHFAPLEAYSVSCLGDSMCGGKSERAKFLAGFVGGKIAQLTFLRM